MAKSYLMCPPDYFEINYEINDWMHQDNQVDQEKARRQWQQIYNTYEKLGHRVKTIDPVAGLPDMIFTANGGQVIAGKALVSNFKFPQRQGETEHFRRWFQAQGFDPVAVSQAVWEGEGDCLLVGDTIYAGSGFRSDPAAAGELTKFFGRDVVSLTLVDPRFYHLDTCFCPLDGRTVMYYPPAFDQASQAKIRQSGLMLIEANEADAAGFGLNAVSDGVHVILSNHAGELIGDLKKRGYKPIPVDVSEFKKSGGGVKCVTLELRS